MSSGVRISAHRNMVSSQVFDEAVHFALLQYQLKVVQQIRDQQTAMVCGLKIEGALEFLDCLRLLAETPWAAPGPVVSENLDPRN